MNLNIDNINQKSGFIALVGKPNVGKSSLLNRLIGEKVAIVTDKPQTTRTKITGVLTVQQTQLVFLDTPGFHKPKTALSHAMIKTINESVADVDLAVLVVEPTGELTKAELALIDDFKAKKLPAIVVINKIDTVKNKEDMMPKIAELASLYDFLSIVPVSALNGEGVQDNLLKIFIDNAEFGPHFFPDDTLTDQPERVICAEIIREKVLMNMHDEIPHGIAVTVEKMKERITNKDGNDITIIDIDATVFCERKSHKGMVIGKGGVMLKRIGSQARYDIESFMGCKINLQCWVKVKEGWRDEERSIRNFIK